MCLACRVLVSLLTLPQSFWKLVGECDFRTNLSGEVSRCWSLGAIRFVISRFVIGLHWCEILLILAIRQSRNFLESISSCGGHYSKDDGDLPGVSSLAVVLVRGQRCCYPFCRATRKFVRFLMKPRFCVPPPTGPTFARKRRFLYRALTAT